MKVEAAVRAVVDDENELVSELGRIGERHSADHDVFHIAHTLATLHRANLGALARFTEVDVEEPGGEGLLGRAREKVSELAGREAVAGIALLRDLRALHLLYAGASIDYVVLAQGAQAARDAELLEVASRCHAQTLRGLKWTVTRIKEAAPQALTA
jgi:hypothetical protein